MTALQFKYFEIPIRSRWIHNFLVPFDSNRRSIKPQENQISKEHYGIAGQFPKLETWATSQRCISAYPIKPVSVGRMQNSENHPKNTRNSSESSSRSPFMKFYFWSDTFLELRNYSNFGWILVTLKFRSRCKFHSNFTNLSSNLEISQLIFNLTNVLKLLKSN